MAYLIFVRIIALTSLFIALKLLPPLLYTLDYSSILFAHFFLQAIYSNRKMQLLNPESANRALILGARLLFLGSLYFLAAGTSYLNITLYFGIHFVLSEFYVCRSNKQLISLRISRLLSCAALYSIFVQSIAPFNLLSVENYSYIFIFAFASQAALSYWLKLSRESFYYLVYEIIGFAFAITYHPSSTPLIDIIFYHLIWWAIYPIAKLKVKPIELAKYVLSSVGMSLAFLALFYCVYYVRLDPGHFVASIHSLNTSGGNIHITLSFALSSSNPDFVNKLFGRIRS